MLLGLTCAKLVCKLKINGCNFVLSWKGVIEAEELEERGSSADELACGSGSVYSRSEGTS